MNIVMKAAGLKAHAKRHENIAAKLSDEIKAMIAVIEQKREQANDNFDKARVYRQRADEVISPSKKSKKKVAA